MSTLHHKLPSLSSSREPGLLRTWLIVAILTAAPVVTACSTATSTAGQPHNSAAQIEALYLASIDRASARFTEADVRFMTAMLAHDTQGRDLAELAVSRGYSGLLRILALRILSNYEDEITLIRQWLSDRQQPLPETPSGAALIAVGPDYVSHLPGMLTRQHIEDLEEATGTEFDRLFLTYSIRHHSTALALVDSLFRFGGAAQDETVFRVASSLRGEQAAYVARMERMLGELPR